MLLPIARGLAPAAEENDVTTTDVHRVIESVLGRRATHSQTRPDEGLGVEYTDVVEVALLEGAANSTHVVFHVLL